VAAVATSSPARLADVRAVPVADVLRERALLEAHWQEIALNKDVMELAPRHEVYDSLESSGALLTLGAFSGEHMVGYSATVILPHLHYGNLIYATNDVLFVAKAHRVGTLGLRLIHETERLSAQRGARLMLWHAKEGSALDLMLGRRKHYAVQDIIYSRTL
jgi:hypothetical protein